MSMQITADNFFTLLYKPTTITKCSASLFALLDVYLLAILTSDSVFIHRVSAITINYIVAQILTAVKGFSHIDYW